MRLFTAGRLDKESEGLIIVTNDGAFANRVIHPSANLTKLYIAKVDREVTIDHLKRLSRGCKVEGTNVVPVKVEKIRKNTIKIGVKEGKKREVRELLSSCDLECIALKRIQIGPYTLGTLPTGAYRQLSSKELALFS